MRKNNISWEHITSITSEFAFSNDQEIVFGFSSFESLIGITHKLLTGKEMVTDQSKLQTEWERLDDWNEEKVVVQIGVKTRAA